MEELKMIVEVVSKVSGDAQTVLIIYFVKEFLTALLVASSWVICLFIIAKSCLKAFSGMSGESKTLESINSMLDDPVSGFSAWYGSNRRSLEKKIRDLTEANRK